LGKYRGKSPATGLKVFKTYKQRGEWGELLFMTWAARRGYVVLKPWGDSARYDVGIERDGKFKRIQVKGTDCREGDGYCCHLSGTRQRAYTAKQIDYFAVYLLPEDIWYIFPAKRLAGQGAVMLSPHSAGSVHERYKEAWEFLDSRKHTARRPVEGTASKVARKREGIRRDSVAENPGR
jgi:hypothetical protein